MTIKDILIKYRKKADFLDLELIISHIIKKSREFVLAHPEYKIPKFKIKNLKLKISRRGRGEPLAYILGRKEFYGLDFKVNKNTLIPRSETELLVEQVISNLKPVTSNRNISKEKFTIIDIGTGSGNIIISVAKNIAGYELLVTGYYGVDISEKALRVAKYNAKKHKADKKIKFLKGNLLEPILKSKIITRKSRIIILANLPYLSSKIYAAAPLDIRKYEPESALLSSKHGLRHYKELFKQLKKIHNTYYPPATPKRPPVTARHERAVSDGGRGIIHTTFILEIGPEQKSELNKLIKQYFLKTKVSFKKDLAGKWRVCIVKIKNYPPATPKRSFGGRGK